METSLDDLFAPIPPLPDDVTVSTATDSRLSEKGVVEGKEEKTEPSRMNDATLPVSKPAVLEERTEAMNDIDSSRTSDGHTQEDDSMRVLAQHARDRQGGLITCLTAAHAQNHCSTTHSIHCCHCACLEGQLSVQCDDCPSVRYMRPADCSTHPPPTPLTKAFHHCRLPLSLSPAQTPLIHTTLILHCSSRGSVC